MALLQEDTGAIKYEVRSTKYEVKELGATGLRRGVGRRQSRNDARGINQGTREVEASLARRASVARMEISIAAFFENFIGMGVVPDNKWNTFPPPERSAPFHGIKTCALCLLLYTERKIVRAVFRLCISFQKRCQV